MTQVALNDAAAMVLSCTLKTETLITNFQIQKFEILPPVIGWEVCDKNWTYVPSFF